MSARSRHTSCSQTEKAWKALCQAFRVGRKIVVLRVNGGHLASRVTIKHVPPPTSRSSLRAQHWLVSKLSNTQ